MARIFADSNEDMANSLRIAAWSVGLFIMLAARPALGQHIQELSYNNSYWAAQDLNSSPLGQSGGAMDGFITTPNNQSHLYYSAGDNHVHQLFYNGTSWGDEDLTQQSGGPPLHGGSGVTGFSVGNYQYVYYVTNYPRNDLYNYHIHQLLYNNVGWVDRDLTAASGAKVTPIGTMIALTTSPALHVYYQASDNHIHQLFSNSGTTWQDQDLSAITGHSLPNFIALDAGFNIGNLQYVYWLDANQHLHQLSYNNSNWSDVDISALTLVALDGAGVQAAFVLPGTQQIRLYGLQFENQHLLEFASPNNGKWTVTDLTRASNAPGVGPMKIVAFPTTPNNQVHVYFSALPYPNLQIYQIFQAAPSTWVSQNLTSLANGSPVMSGPDSQFSTGFSIQNYQYLFYIVP